MIAKHIHAFVLGMKEFRCAFCTSVDARLNRTYDRGRDFAHKITLRRFDHI